MTRVSVAAAILNTNRVSVELPDYTIDIIHKKYHLSIHLERFSESEKTQFVMYLFFIL
jgi:hypothetical protein